MIYISVQKNNFSHAEEYQKLIDNDMSQGAVVTFTGRVRGIDNEQPDSEKIIALELEYYPSMTEKVLYKLAEDAIQRWSVTAVTIIHRIGKLYSGEQIVFVGVASRHRKSAFEACEFLIDILKTEAPFWKKEFTKDTEIWVESKSSDVTQMDKWLKD